MMPAEILDEFLQCAFGTSDPHKINVELGWMFDFADAHQQVFWHSVDCDAFDGQVLVEIVQRFNSFLRTKAYPYQVRIRPGKFKVLKDDKNQLFIIQELKVSRRGDRAKKRKAL